MMAESKSFRVLIIFYHCLCLKIKAYCSYKIHKSNTYIFFLDMWYRNVLSSNVLKLQEKGKITQLKNKWWKEKRGGGACRVSQQIPKAEIKLIFQ